ncbi:Cytochrome P450 4V2 [Chamberlinius hualienensis]
MASNNNDYYYDLKSGAEMPTVEKRSVRCYQQNTGTDNYGIFQDIPKALLTNPKNLTKLNIIKALQKAFGHGLVTSDVSIWHKHRKLINPTFSIGMLNEFCETMNKQANVFVELIKNRSQKCNYQPFDICPFVSRCALDIITETIMGEDVNAQLNEDSQYPKAVDHAVHAVLNFAKFSIVPNSLCRWALKKEEKVSLKFIEDFTDKLIEKQRKKIEIGQSIKNVNSINEDESNGVKRRLALLDLLLVNSVNNNENTPSNLSNQEIRDELTTFIIAGHETTSCAISFVLLCIAAFPQIQIKINEELDSIFETDDNNPEVTPKHMQKMKYLNCVIKESIRLISPVPNYGRNLNEAIDICGYKIPAGTDVCLLVSFLHRNPSVFQNPDSFNPDRFLPENSVNRDPFDYLPFSTGLRNCIGQKYAMMEIKVVTAKILRRFWINSPVDLKTIDKKLMCDLVTKVHGGIPIQFQLKTTGKEL